MSQKDQDFKNAIIDDEVISYLLSKFPIYQEKYLERADFSDATELELVDVAHIIDDVLDYWCAINTDIDFKTDEITPKKGVNPNFFLIKENLFKKDFNPLRDALCRSILLKM